MELVDNTFWMDFTIAEAFGQKAVKDTYKRASKEWLSDVKMFTALVAILNHKCWHWYQRGNEPLSKLYANLYHTGYNLGARTFKGDDFQYFWNTLD